MRNTYLYIGAGIAVALVLAAFVFAYLRTKELEDRAAAGMPVSYSCAEGKSFTVTFTDGAAALTLEDGRAFLLPQAIAGSGIRYEREGILLIGKGDDAQLEENGVVTHADCVANAGGDTGIEGVSEFMDQGGVFSFRYPSAFSVTGGGIGYTEAWMQGSSALGLVLAEVSVPRAFMPDTNFSDAKLTIGTSADPVAIENCLLKPEGMDIERAETTVNNTTYTRYRYTDAGAGNRYETTSYRLLLNDQCYAVEYTIHSTAIENYPDDAGITEFDRDRVVAALESIVRSVTWYSPK